MLRARIFFSVVMFVCSGFSVVVFSESIMREPYLQLVSESSITVVWRTKGAIEPVVRYGAKMRRLKLASEAENVTLRVSDDVKGVEAPTLHSETALEREKRESRRRNDRTGVGDICQYEVKLTGLDANPSYKEGDARKRLTTHSASDSGPPEATAPSAPCSSDPDHANPGR